MYIDAVKVISSNLLKAFQALSDVNKANLAYELCKFLLWQDLRESVGRHTVSRDPLDVNA